METTDYQQALIRALETGYVIAGDRFEELLFRDLSHLNPGAKELLRLAMQAVVETFSE